VSRAWSDLSSYAQHTGDRDFTAILKGGHFAEMLEYAERRAPTVWDNAICANHDPASDTDLAGSTALSCRRSSSMIHQRTTTLRRISSRRPGIRQDDAAPPTRIRRDRQVNRLAGTLALPSLGSAVSFDELYKGSHDQYRVVGEHRYWGSGPERHDHHRRVEP
jgi:hypothetical protein